MRSFEGLRPIITEHFYMDWLTEFKLQSVIDFQKQQDEQADIMSTSNFINAIMNDVMSQKGLLWGVMDKDTKQFVGVAGISNLQSDAPIVYVNVSNISSDAEIELIKRIAQFKHQYWPDKSSQFNVSPINDEIKDVINAL
ncbi:hypothetical protein AKUA2003_11270 [Apilactobacillus kunkeei]|nr:hypothetical protein AKUA1001_11300 [Apilactobacillus kunkeei]CAI2635822.1 hypothetical protein AKUA2003_11270 [Apilactobacillus kunkeei]CAI2802958.1 hypothetical protein AKUA2002_11290 [Apilactobacillus kunkeei]